MLKSTINYKKITCDVLIIGILTVYRVQRK